MREKERKKIFTGMYFCRRKVTCCLGKALALTSLIGECLYLFWSFPLQKKKKPPPNGSVKEDCALPSPVAKVNHSVHLPAPITGHGLATLTSGIVSLPSQKVA